MFVQKIIHFIKIQKIHSKQIFIFLKIQNIHSNKYSFFFEIQNIHSKKLFIFIKSRIFIQKKYSFFSKKALSPRARPGGYQDRGDGRQVNQDYLLIECMYKTFVSSKCLVGLFYA